MNTHQHPQHSDQQHIDERRWQAQEKARRGDVDADPVELRIAQALRHAPAVHLPADFAARLAAQVQAQAATNLRLEQFLVRGLVLVFAAGTAVVTAWYGRGWAAALAGSLPGGSAAAGWCGLALGCLLLNWGSGVLRQRVGGHLRPLV